MGMKFINPLIIYVYKNNILLVPTHSLVIVDNLSI